MGTVCLMSFTSSSGKWFCRKSQTRGLSWQIQQSSVQALLQGGRSHSIQAFPSSPGSARPAGEPAAGWFAFSGDAGRPHALPGQLTEQMARQSHVVAGEAVARREGGRAGLRCRFTGRWAACTRRNSSDNLRGQGSSGEGATHRRTVLSGTGRSRWSRRWCQSLYLESGWEMKKRGSPHPGLFRPNPVEA